MYLILYKLKEKMKIKYLLENQLTLNIKTVEQLNKQILEKWFNDAVKASFKEKSSKYDWKLNKKEEKKMAEKIEKYGRI